MKLLVLKIKKVRLAIPLARIMWFKEHDEAGLISIMIEGDGDKAGVFSDPTGGIFDWLMCQADGIVEFETEGRSF